LPVDMTDWVPADDMVHLVVDAVDLMDLSAFEAASKVGGAALSGNRHHGWSALDPRVPSG
jgi:hypothetical protein